MLISYVPELQSSLTSISNPFFLLQALFSRRVSSIEQLLIQWMVFLVQFVVVVMVVKGAVIVVVVMMPRRPFYAVSSSLHVKKIALLLSFLYHRWKMHIM